MIKLFLARESLVTDIPAGDRKIVNFFKSVDSQIFKKISGQLFKK
jgi:hypothetical protein